MGLKLHLVPLSDLKTHFLSNCLLMPLANSVLSFHHFNQGMTSLFLFELLKFLANIYWLSR